LVCQYFRKPRNAFNEEFRDYLNKLKEKDYPFHSPHDILHNVKFVNFPYNNTLNWDEFVGLKQSVSTSNADYNCVELKSLFSKYENNGAVTLNRCVDVYVGEL
jgi:hypothetical protein